jgi:hypothetical protein
MGANASHRSPQSDGKTGATDHPDGVRLNEGVPPRTRIPLTYKAVFSYNHHARTDKIVR